MTPDDFEQKIQRQAIRQVPAEWRERILAAARCQDQPAASAKVGSVESAAWWRNWFWPSPWAWGGAAAAWMMIFALNFAASEGGEETTVARAVPASVIDMAFAERRTLMNSLLDFTPPEPAVAPREPIRPRPHSECGKQWSRA